MHLKLICNRTTFYNGHRLVISMCIHMTVEVVFLNDRFPTFSAAVIEFSPDRSLMVTQPDLLANFLEQWLQISSSS